MLYVSTGRAEDFEPAASSFIEVIWSAPTPTLIASWTALATGQVWRPTTPIPLAPGRPAFGELAVSVPYHQTNDVYAVA
jgi:hypothetical protein